MNITQKKTHIKPLPVLIVIAIATFSFLQSNDAQYLINGSSSVSQFLKISAANACGECRPGSGCVMYVDGKPYVSYTVACDSD